MKIRRKLLTTEQKQAICKAHVKCWDGCPLYGYINGADICCKDIPKIEQDIVNYWNEEVKI